MKTDVPYVPTYYVIYNHVLGGFATESDEWSYDPVDAELMPPESAKSDRRARVYGSVILEWKEWNVKGGPRAAGQGVAPQQT